MWSKTSKGEGLQMNEEGHIVGCISLTALWKKMSILDFVLDENSLDSYKQQSNMI